VIRDQLSVRHALALGLIQGPAELLPISSSSHTALIPWLMRWRWPTPDVEQRRALEVALHAGTATALLIRGVTGEPLQRPPARLVLLATAPPALAGYALERFIDRRLSTPPAIAVGLLIGAACMAASDAAVASGRRAQDARAVDALLLGAAQVLALAPGVSRNGATLAVARARGFSRADADALSWHLGVPVMAGAASLKLFRGRWRWARAGGNPTLLAGATAAFVSTLASASAMEAWRSRIASRSAAADARRGLRSTGRLTPYAAYRLALALLVIRRVRQDRTRSARRQLRFSARAGRRTASA
jgi:undecaprenyl-diphosphatase